MRKRGVRARKIRRAHTTNLRAQKVNASGGWSPFRSRRPPAWFARLVTVFAAVWALAVAAQPRIDSFHERLAGWWEGWSRELGRETREALPALMSRVREDEAFARAMIGQGLPSLGLRRGTQSPLADWREEAKSLLALLTPYDLDDPGSLVAWHLPGGYRAKPAPDPPVSRAWGLAGVSSVPSPPAAAGEGAEPGERRVEPGAPGTDREQFHRLEPSRGSPSSDPEGGVPGREPSLTPPAGGSSPPGGMPAPGGLRSPFGREVWGSGPQVAILHSHTSEMYRTDDFRPESPDQYHRFNSTDTGIVRVGAELAERLRLYGMEVVHVQRVHDYPLHPLAYRRSRETVQELMRTYPTLQVILDVHRDSPPGLVATVGGVEAGQVMILVGSGEDTRGLLNPSWRENFRLAQELEAVLNARYPGLHRRTWVRGDARFNQDLHPGMLLLEIGSYETHIDQALASARMVGDALAEVLWSRRTGNLGFFGLEPLSPRN